MAVELNRPPGGADRAMHVLVVPAHPENKRERLAAELLASDAYGSTAGRFKAFVDRGGGCRATLFNYRRELGNGSGNGAE